VQPERLGGDLLGIYPLGYSFLMTPTVDISTLSARHADGAFVLDVREPGEYLAGHVPGSVLAPMSRITSALGGVPRDRTVHVICQSGNRSRAMADLLGRLGYDAVSVDGGYVAWAAGGRPVIAGPRAA
jgi:rhodanese-related sulfurtransferase